MMSDSRDISFSQPFYPSTRDCGPFSVRHSSVNISATRTSLAMILDEYESPTRRLSYVVPFGSNFEVFYVKFYRTLQSFHTESTLVHCPFTYSTISQEPRRVQT